jgi:hypothetical protein
VAILDWLNNRLCPETLSSYSILQPVRGGALSFSPRSIYCTGLVFNFSSWKPLHVAMLKNLLGGSLKKVALLSLQAEMAP